MKSNLPLLCLPKPKSSSHKGQNGAVLIIGGSKTYHGAPILSAIAAMRFCDLVYFHSTPENMGVVKKMKIATPNVICVQKEKFSMALSHSDCVLIGNGMEPSAATSRQVASILKTKKKCVLDAAAIKVAPKGLLHEKAILTPHAIEFKAAFGTKATPASVAAMSKKYGCTILFKGPSDTIAFAGKAVQTSGGNAGMTKGGTGDTLAGLVAALYSHPSCPSPLHAAFTGAILTKRAGDLLHHAMGCNFSSEDLARELAHAAWGLYKY